MLCYLHRLETNKTLSKENVPFKFKHRKQEMYNTQYTPWWILASSGGYSHYASVSYWASLLVIIE